MPPPNPKCPEPNEGTAVLELLEENGELAIPGVGDELNREAPALVPLPEPKVPPVIAGDIEYIVALKGFAPPALPVACGRSPTPTVAFPKPLIAPVD